MLLSGYSSRNVMWCVQMRRRSWAVSSADVIGENRRSIISRRARKQFQCGFPSGTRSPMMKGRYLPRHHICEAEIVKENKKEVNSYHVIAY